jgi:metal-responsive CopG/Arc/MetJ family transcriptional regulator
METIQIVIDKKLLSATDRAARRARRNRSALIREALRQHLRRLSIQEMEERERRGYAAHPENPRESQAWEAEAAWPE